MSEVSEEKRLADRRWFALDADQWEEFLRLLDAAPPSECVKLRRLLSEPSPFISGSES